MLTREEFDEIYAMERYLVRKDWRRAPELGPGMWEKYDPYGSMIMGLQKAYEVELQRDSVN